LFGGTFRLTRLLAGIFPRGELPSLRVESRWIAQPEPIGWNFKTSDTSLKRFKKRYDKKAQAAERAAALADAQELIQQTAADEETYVNAARRLLKIRLYKKRCRSRRQR
jgi:hypothetical protein